jgi:hypothetical protein
MHDDWVVIAYPLQNGERLSSGYHEVFGNHFEPVDPRLSLEDLPVVLRPLTQAESEGWRSFHAIVLAKKNSGPRPCPRQPRARRPLEMSLIPPRTQASNRDLRPIEPAACLVIDQPTVPPFASQAFADLAGSHPWPLQEFWPLHALLAVLQALCPLQALIPMHSTPAFLAEAGVTDTPFMASAIAATARLVPENYSVIHADLPWERLEKRATHEPAREPTPPIRWWGLTVYIDHAIVTLSPV